MDTVDEINREREDYIAYLKKVRESDVSMHEIWIRLLHSTTCNRELEFGFVWFMVCLSFFNSQGFDVGSSRGLRIPGGITPVNLDRLGDYIEKLNDLCKLTMQDYNEKEVAASCYFVMV